MWKGQKCDSHLVCGVEPQLKFYSKPGHYIMSIYTSILVNTCISPYKDLKGKHYVIPKNRLQLSEGPCN